MKYFSIQEFEYSATAKAKGIDNSIPENIKQDIIMLIENILDPLVDAWGSEIIISSGYRGLLLNKVIGGSNTSAHTVGGAADLVPKNGRISEFKQFVMDWLKNNNILFDQYINEIKTNSEWVHIGIKNHSGQQRKQYMLYKNGKYTSINPITYKVNNQQQQQKQTNNSTTSSTNTQNNKNDLLTGTSIYYDKSIDYNAIKSNDIFVKNNDGTPTETTININGQIITKFQIDDSYLNDPNYEEDTIDNLQDINELPKEPDDTLTNILTDISGTSENVKGITINKDGTIIANKTRTIKQIVILFQQWKELVQTLKISIQNISKTTQKGTLESNGTTTINAQVYIKAAFDKYGHAFRDGMTCPVCGKTVKYLPPGGYCSVECALTDAKNKAMSFLRQPNEKYKEEIEIIYEITAILDLTSLIINALTMIPDILKDLLTLPDEWKEYIINEIALGFSELQVCAQELMIKKNKKIIKLLKPIKKGVAKKVTLKIASAVLAIQNAMDEASKVFNNLYSKVMLALQPLTTVGGLAINAESFALAATPRSFLSPMPYTCPDAKKVFINLPGGSGMQSITLAKPLMPSGLETIDFSSLDAIIQSCFPPLLPTDYYLEPELFEIRYLFSDQSDLVFQIRQQLEDFLSGGPDYIPKFENLLPVKKFTNISIAGQTIIPEMWLPNIGYIWFVLGLLDAWAPHSQALVGSVINPAI